MSINNISLKMAILDTLPPSPLYPLEFAGPLPPPSAVNVINGQHTGPELGQTQANRISHKGLSINNISRWGGGGVQLILTVEGKILTGTKGRGSKMAIFRLMLLMDSPL